MFIPFKKPAVVIHYNDGSYKETGRDYTIYKFLSHVKSCKGAWRNSGCSTTSMPIIIISFFIALLLSCGDVYETPRPQTGFGAERFIVLRFNYAGEV
jgi:hypothetical protein